MVAAKSNPKFQKKTVKFGGKDLVLFSLDGQTWSSRPDELLAIKERHESEKVTIEQIRTGGGAMKPEAGAAVEEEEETKDEILEDEEEVASLRKSKSKHSGKGTPPDVKKKTPAKGSTIPEKKAKEVQPTPKKRATTKPVAKAKKGKKKAA